MLLAVAIVAALAASSAHALSPDDDGDHGEASSHANPIAQEMREREHPAAGLQEPDGGDDPAGEADHAALIADEFDVSEDEVLELRADGTGWGAMFKLYALARAQGVDVDDLIAAATVDEDGGHGFAFGEMKNALTDDELEELDDGPKNFGQLVSKSKKPAHAGP
jgi:hypothetical protein